MQISTEKADAYREFYFWKKNYTGCFSNQFFDLICKADMHNREHLRRAFPLYVDVWEEWVDADNGETFLKVIEEKLFFKERKSNANY